MQLKGVSGGRETALCVLFSVSALIPRLDVAGSTPVSRSKINHLRTLAKHTLHSLSFKHHAALFRIGTKFVRTDSSSCFAAPARSSMLDLV